MNHLCHDCTKTLALDINDLENLVAVNSYFFPSYEVRSAQNTIAELKEWLDSLNSQLFPKKKFTFKNRDGRLAQTSWIFKHLEYVAFTFSTIKPV